MALVEVTDLVKEFPVTSGGLIRRQIGKVHAVSGVSFDIDAGETLGLVGESGSGKSTTGRAVLQLHEPTAGSVRYNDRELIGLHRTELRELRKDIQMVFQDPYASLNPKMPVNDIVAEPFVIHEKMSASERLEKVAGLLKDVGLRPEHGNRYPHEFSGGQRQRIGIARSLALDPGFIVLDEPVSALDVSVQAGVINLLKRIQDERNIAYLFIAHDLSVVRHVSDRVAVMYLGKIVEIAVAPTCIGRRRIRTRSHCCRLCRCRPRAVNVNVPASCSRVMFRRRSTRPVVVDSAPGVGAATELCAEVEPELVERFPGSFSACHHPVEPGEPVEVTAAKSMV